MIRLDCVIFVALSVALGCQKPAEPAGERPAAPPGAVGEPPAPAVPTADGPAVPTADGPAVPTADGPAVPTPTTQPDVATPKRLEPQVGGWTPPAPVSAAEQKRVYHQRGLRVARRENSAALKARRESDHAEAKRAYLRALAAAPGFEAARFNLACEHALKGDADSAIAELEHLLRQGTIEARKYLSKSRIDSDFDPIRSDGRLQTIAKQFEVDFDADVTTQLCADFGKVGTVVDSEVGLMVYDDATSKPGIPNGHITGGKARGAVYMILDSWCRDGKRRREDNGGQRGEQYIGAPPHKSVLNKWSGKNVRRCLTGWDYMSDEDQHLWDTTLCFFDRGSSWVIGVVYIASHDDAAGSELPRVSQKAQSLFGL